ncbi:MAG: lytic transglycosylase domain-containing protein, partial [Bacteroidaceae bacterium]|nr:lytic transglycosylase domain-containing protein [Bacteroidaceae bacterium]
MDKKIFITFITAFIWLGCGTLNAQVRVAEEPLAADSLILPEGMQAHELDSLLNDWNVRSHLTADDSCNATGENPQFTEEEYISRLSRLPNVIEMPYNKEVRRYIDQYCERMRRSISIFLGAGNFYIPLFEEALESYQLPLELKYLPIIESALNPKATSRVGAAGLWQFMIATGKQYGLEVTSLVDERRDPIKSSYAAARYLKDLYDMFGDWTLVIASYNCGPNNTLKAITRA